MVCRRPRWLVDDAVGAQLLSIGYTQAHFDGDNLSLTLTGTPIPGAHRDGVTAGGWFIGGGIEVAMHDGWFWRSEVRYSDYSKDGLAETQGGALVGTVNFDPVVETATSEIVYKFNWGH
jgi:outer membrane immunogenic protein